MDHKELNEQADKLIAAGWRLTWGVTVPIALFILGIFIMPLGLIAWAVAVIMFLTINSNSIKEYADSKQKGDEKN